MTQDEDIKQACLNHPELPESLIRQVFHVCHQATSKRQLVDNLLGILELDFLLDNSENDTDTLSSHFKAYSRLKPAEWIIDADVMFEIEDMFGSFEKAIGWLRQPHASLGGERPGDYCTRHINGSLKVSELLQEMKPE